jgi:argininosuccinate lyase
MAKKLWGGRFKKATDAQFEEFSRSIQYDYKLAEYDILHSMIHVTALFNAGMLTVQEGKQLNDALTQVLSGIEDGSFTPDLAYEDIHSDIQHRVEKIAGDAAGKLHTLRSRNDQIAFDVKAYCFSEAMDTIVRLRAVLIALEDLAVKYDGMCFPGYTHTQHAQVILFSDYCHCWAHMLARDLERFDSYLQRLSIPVGAGALAGSAIPSEAYAEAVKEVLDGEGPVSGPVVNALEHVSDRDFVVELLSIVSITQMHLSRFAEDMILYSTAEYRYLDLPEEFCTGSSLMPHKKNADFMELMRGSTGRVYGDLISVLTTMKGLPSSYNRDMQLDKEPLFSSLELLQNELEMLARFIPGITLREDVIVTALDDEHFYGVEVAQYLVEQGVAFADAHEVVGKLIRYAEDNDCEIREMSDEALRGFHPSLNQQAVNEVMTPEYAVNSKKSIKR